MSTVHRLPTAPVVRLALPPAPDGAARPSSRRRAVLGLALLAVTVPVALIAIGKISLPRAGSPTAVPAAPAAAREAQPARSPAQLRDAPSASKAQGATDRVVSPRRATSLFAPHSWYVAPPPPPPVAPPPPPAPTAPPFPYAFVGSFAPKGEQPVFFLSRGDRVIDAHVGDRLEGVYDFESATGSQLVFVYLPLNIRQSLAVGASQ